MTDWNFDMSAAPKGEVIAQDAHGGVILSKWLPEEGRWRNFHKANPPIAWQPWPDHPEAGK